MKPARIAVLAIALLAGGIAAFLAGRSDPTPPLPAPVVQLDTVEVLIANVDIGMGHAVSDQELRWQIWPTGAAGPSFIRKNERPDAIEQIAGSIARQPFAAGEPIREIKLIRAKGSGYLAAILPTGMRAISTEITPETGAGGFILPNDRVDVILTKREKSPDSTNTQDLVISVVILTNIRVLAIDQAPKEKDGQNAVVGKTVTLELKPEQTVTLGAARQAGTLSLALRSIADVNMVENAPELAVKPGASITVVRHGVPSSQAAQK